MATQKMDPLQIENATFSDPCSFSWCVQELRVGLGDGSRALSPSGEESLQQLEDPTIQMRPHWSQHLDVSGEQKNC